MSSYTHFTLEERECLQELLAKGYGVRKAAAAMGRSPSTISREIKRNKSKKPKKPSNNPHNYHHWRAHILATERRRKKSCRRLRTGTPEWDYVVEKLKLFWSPEQIAERWKKEHPDAPKFGVSTIYRALKRGEFEDISSKTHLRRRGKRIKSRTTNHNSIQPDRIIPDWSDEIRLRTREGDWEGDTVYGAIGKGAVVTLVDRKTRFLCARLIPSRDASVTREAVEAALQGKPVHSISFDNGSEFAEFRLLEKNLHTLVFFAEPHKPWQRGSNENTNDLLRFFFPKGFDFHSITQDALDAVVDLINNRPRKCLNWSSPAEVFLHF